MRRSRDLDAPRVVARGPRTLDYRGAYAIMMEAMQSADGDEGVELDSDEIDQLLAWEEEGEVSQDWKDEWGDTVWELRSVPVSELWVDSHYEIDDEKVDTYVSWDSTTAPPILLHRDGHPLDGQHRLRAAQLRGDATISAWVPR